MFTFHGLFLLKGAIVFLLFYIRVVFLFLIPSFLMNKGNMYIHN